jgi:hypothetical protein
VGDHVVVLGQFQHLGEAALPRTQLLFDLGPAPPCLGGGVPRLLALLVAQRGNRHNMSFIWQTGALAPARWRLDQWRLVRKH